MCEIKRGFLRKVNNLFFPTFSFFFFFLGGGRKCLWLVKKTLRRNERHAGGASLISFNEKKQINLRDFMLF